MPTFETTVEIADDHRVVVKVPADFPEGRARVVIEPAPAKANGVGQKPGTASSSESQAEARRKFWMKVLDERSRRKDGMTFAEIQAYIKEERDSWE
jgi:hypothetical protein